MFCGKREKAMSERKKKTIYCPDCNRKAFEIYEGSGMVVSNKCSKCKKLVVYNPRYGVILKPIPERHCSSGTRFY